VSEIAAAQVDNEEGKFSDLGNARLLVSLHGEDLHYCFHWKKWLVWDGMRWRVDDTGEVERRAKNVVEELISVVQMLHEKIEQIQDEIRKRIKP
jgi:putative DNA primase/helicase